MDREPRSLTEREHDVVVVGGGIFGIAVAREAVLRGLSVALLERRDLAAATSSNSFRMIHGGIRYLQHLDVPRLRASSRERNVLLRTAPHLVHPLPIVIPTYGHGTEGKLFLRAGMFVYDLLTLDRNRGIRDPERRVPATRGLSRDAVLARFPGIRKDGLTGACVFADAQMHHPARLAVAMARSAAREGARVCNYVAATDFLSRGDRITGVKARDAVSGETFPVRGRYVVNAAGSWAEPLLRECLGLELRPPSTFSRDLCFVVGREASQDWGVAVLGDTRDPDAMLSRSRRHLFVVPWNGRMLVGVWHTVYRRPPDRVEVTGSELEGYLAELNRSYPGLELGMDEIALCNAGLVLFGENEAGADDLSYGKRSRVVDHEAAHGIEGLLTLIGVRYTTARADAEELVDGLVARIGHGTPAGPSREEPVFGGDVGSFANLVREVRGALPPDTDREVADALARGYGSEYGRVLAYGEERPDLLRTLPDTRVLGAEIVHGIHEEMALTLEDLVFRRTPLGTAGPPPEPALREAATIAARELGWSEERRADEVAGVVDRFPLAPPVRAAEEVAGESGVR